MYGPGVFLDADAGGGSGTGSPQPDAGGNGGKTLTQEQVDALVGAARKEGRDSGIAKILKDLGVDDADSLKKLVESARTAEDASKTELQKLTDDLAKAQKQAEKLEAETGQKLVAMQERLLVSEIKIAAGRPVVDQDGKVKRAAFHIDILDDIGLLIDRSLITEKDGKYEGIEKALEELAKKKPILLVAQADGKGTKPKGTPDSTQQRQKQENREQRPAPTSSKSIFS